MPTPLPTGDPAALTRILDDSVGGMVDVWRAHGNLVAYRTPHVTTVFAFGPDNNRLIFGHPDDLHVNVGLPGPRKSVQRASTRGMFGLNGADHQHRRRLLMPFFKKVAVGAYHARLEELIGEVLGAWRPGQTRDLADDMKRAALILAVRVLFGVDDLAHAHAIDEAFDEWVRMNHRAGFAACLPVPDGIDTYPRLIEAGEKIGEGLRILLAERRATPPAGDDVLAPLLAAQDAGELTDDDTIGLTSSLFNAAHHTTTAGLTWTLFLLAQHPDVAARVLDELDRHGGPGEIPDADRIDRLGLLDRVVKESLRMLPPVVYVPRVAAKAICFGDVEVPAGAIVFGGIYVTQHTPGAFADPERFDPDRWLALGPCPHAQVAFGGGARMCLGAPLATHLMKMMVAAVMRRFRLAVVPGTRIDRDASLTLRPRPALPVTLHRQDRRFAATPVAGEIHEMVKLPTPAATPAAA